MKFDIDISFNLAHTASMKITNYWYGVLNKDNINCVAQRLREMLVGKHVAIATAHYVDSKSTDLRLIADCEVDSRWTSEPRSEPIRVFNDEGDSWIGFSAGGYSWSFGARPDSGQGHEDYQYPYFSFEYDKVTVTTRAPAGAGYLHKHVFGAHNQS